MSEYKKRFEKWQRDAKETFDEIDQQLGLTDAVSEGTKTVLDTAQKGADKLRTEAEKTEIGKKAVKAAEGTIKTAEDAAKKIWDVSEPMRDAAGDASGKAGEVVVEAGKTAGEVISAVGGKAGEVFNDTKDAVGTNAKRAAKAFNIGAGWTRTFDSAIRSFSNASEWIQQNPLQAAATGASMAVGAGLGVVFTGLSSHWLFNSALPAWSVQKLGSSFNDYLKSQEEKIAAGDLDEAKAESIRFEADIARKIGAPMLGAFSFASGAVMMTNVFNPKEVTGAPISWLLGGNPMLEGVWFFGNGMVCFQTSYDFFMIALDGQKDVEKMMKEIKGLLGESS